LPCMCVGEWVSVCVDAGMQGRMGASACGGVTHLLTPHRHATIHPPPRPSPASLLNPNPPPDRTPIRTPIPIRSRSRPCLCLWHGCCLRPGSGSVTGCGRGPGSGYGSDSDSDPLTLTLTLAPALALGPGSLSGFGPGSGLVGRVVLGGHLEHRRRVVRRRACASGSGRVDAPVRQCVSMPRCHPSPHIRPARYNPSPSSP
jgi:hypothetical protein